MATIAVACAKTDNGLPGSDQPVNLSNNLIAQTLAKLLIDKQSVQSSTLNVSGDSALKQLSPTQAIQKDNQQLLIKFVQGVIMSHPNVFETLNIDKTTVKIKPTQISLSEFSTNSSRTEVTAKIVYNPSNSQAGTSTSLITLIGFKQNLSNNIIAEAVAKEINKLNPMIGGFAATEQMQYMAPSYAAGKMIPQITSFLQNLIKTNPQIFNNVEISANTKMKISPEQISVSYTTDNPISANTQPNHNSLYASINYNPSGKPSSGSNSSEVVLNGFNGFNSEQRTKIAAWFNEQATQTTLMKNLLDTAQGKTFLADLLNQTFFKFVIKGLGNNFELQSVTLNNDIKTTALPGPYSAFVLKIKTTAAAQYSATVSSSSKPFMGFTSFNDIPSGSIINFQLPLTFKLSPFATADIYQPSYALSGIHTNVEQANPSWSLMNGVFNQYNPWISWTLPPNKQGNTYPASAVTIGVLGVNAQQRYPNNLYTLSITGPDNTSLVSSANLFFRFAKNASQTAYDSSGNLVANGISYVKMPIFVPTITSAADVFSNLFQQILTVIKS